MSNSTSKNLGQVSSLHIGNIPPDNKNMIWIDTSVNPNVRKIYDYTINEWTELSIENIEKKINELISITYSNNTTYDSIIYGTYINSSIFLDLSSNIVELNTNILYLDINFTNTSEINKAYIYKEGINGGLVEYLSTERNYTLEITIKYWTNTTPNADYNTYWYNPDNKELRCYVANGWQLAQKPQYAIYKYDNKIYVWTSYSMMQIGILESKLKKTITVETYNEIQLASTEFTGSVCKTTGSVATLTDGSWRNFNVDGLTQVAITGYSPAEGNDYCLAIIQSSSDSILQTININTGLYYDKLIIQLPEYSSNIIINGFGTVHPMAYEISQEQQERWIFYTTEEVDDLLANFNTEVSHDTTLKGNGKPDNPLGVNEVGLNALDKYFVSEAEKLLLDEMSPIEFSMIEVINGNIILENPYKLYKINIESHLVININTTHVDLSKYIKFFLKINLNEYVSITFPDKFYFSNLSIPTEKGEYMYEVISSDGGVTWRATLRYKNIVTVGIDQEGNEIIGAKIIYVDGEKADNSGNGLTWLNAKRDIQEAIDLATTGDAVFVKGKIGGLKYLPTKELTPGTVRSKSFILKSGVSVFGGFKGIESSIYEREMVSYLSILKIPTGTQNLYVDIPKYSSILSGEINGNSVIDNNISTGNKFTSASIANNSYHVVYFSSGSTTLSGFEIIGGNTAGAPTTSGGGVYATGNLRLTNCSIYNNTGSNGGGTNGGINTNCSIYNNTGNNGGGTNSSTNTNCSIYNNTGNSGGGAYGGAYGGTNTNCAIYNNTSNSGGGAYGGTNTNCAIYNNTSSGGGGGAYSSTNTNCSIYNNTGGGGGGGAYGGTNTNCSIYNNTGNNGGGTNSSTNTNCSIYNNTGNSGGGTNGGTNTNCSISRNKCNSVGGGTSNSINKNSVIYRNEHSSGTKSNVYNDNSSVETYCAFENEVRAGEGNISLSANNEGDATSPYFVSLSTSAGVVDEVYVSNLQIKNLSYLIDKGNNTFLTTGYASIYDLLTNTRKKDILDIGAYENQKL